MIVLFFIIFTCIRNQAYLLTLTSQLFEFSSEIVQVYFMIGSAISSCNHVHFNTELKASRSNTAFSSGLFNFLLSLILTQNYLPFILIISEISETNIFCVNYSNTFNHKLAIKLPLWLYFAIGKYYSEV